MIILLGVRDLLDKNLPPWGIPWTRLSVFSQAQQKKTEKTSIIAFQLGFLL